MRHRGNRYSGWSGRSACHPVDLLHPHHAWTHRGSRSFAASLEAVVSDADAAPKHRRGLGRRLYHTACRYSTWRATHPAWSLPEDPYLSPILTHRGERTSILMCKRPGCRPTEVRARVPPPADGSGPATARGRSDPRLGLHRGGAKASVPPRSSPKDYGGERVNGIFIYSIIYTQGATRAQSRRSCKHDS